MDTLILKSFSPEIFLSFSILSTLIFNVYLTNNSFFNFPLIEVEIFNQLFIILVIVLFLFLNLKIEIIQNDFIFFNSFGSNFLKVIFIIFCILSLSPIVSSFKIQKLNFFEYFVIYLFAVLSLLLLLSTSDLLVVYLLIELQTLAFFVLACFDRKSAFSTESGLKYFISGSFISGVFLGGCVLLYGCLGSLNLNNINLMFSFDFCENMYILKLICLFSSLLILITFIFKVAGAPFHFWVPDVYEGAPLPSTIIFSILPKISIFFFLIKWVYIILPCFGLIKTFLIFSGILTIFLGSFLGLRQKRFKRLIIYSSIAQGGFLIAGLSIVNNIDDIAFIYFFIIVYLISSILIWLQFSFFYVSNYSIENYFNNLQKPIFISTISNFFQTNKVWALSFIMIFFSIAGLPPLSGFLSKILILSSIIKINLFSLNLFLILISVFSTFYYLKIIKVIFFEFKVNTLSTRQSFLVITKSLFFDFDCLIISFLLFLLIYLFFFPNLLLILLENMVLNILYF